MRYRVTFDFLNNLGEWMPDSVSFDGTMTAEEAQYCCNDFRRREGIRNVIIEKY